MAILLYEAITKSIIAAFYAVYDKLGYGFSEKVFAAALVIELRKRRHRVARDVCVPVYYDGIEIARYNVDFVVDEVVVLELKSTKNLTGPTTSR
jgi:GxxExxY protein